MKEDIKYYEKQFLDLVRLKEAADKMVIRVLAVCGTDLPRELVEVVQESEKALTKVVSRARAVFVTGIWWADVYNVYDRRIDDDATGI